MKLTKTSLKTTEDNDDLFDYQAKPCLDLINEAVAAEPGIVGVKLDPQQQQIAFDYDPYVIAEPAVTQIAQQIASPLQHNLEKCVMRLGPRGGRACESCALLLENRLGQIEGVRGLVQGLDIGVGSLRYFAGFECLDLEAATAEVERLQAEGKTAIAVAQITERDQSAQLLGVIAFADGVRPDAAKVVAELKSLGLKRVVMLTGDNERVAQTIAAQVGLDEYFAGLLPEDKVRIVKELAAQYGPVAMIGDGVNDAPALASAAIGVAMGAAGTDVALETADVVLMADDLSNIPYMIGLSRQTRKTLLVNLGFAMTAIIIMLAAIFVINLPLPLAVVGHEGGTVLVSLNGLRLLLYRKRPARRG